MLSYGPPPGAQWHALAGSIRLISLGIEAREIPIQRSRDFRLVLAPRAWARYGRAPSTSMLKRSHLV
jgi:hypothetical protein